MRRLILIGFIVISSLLLAACSAGGEDQTEGTSLAGYEELVGAIRERNGSDLEVVESQDMIEQPFFTVNGQILTLGGADLQVFQYSSEEARQAESEQISADGSSIGTSMITWIDQPNFWAKDNLIVLYVGTDTTVRDVLTDILGDPLTQ